MEHSITDSRTEAELGTDQFGGYIPFKDRERERERQKETVIWKSREEIIRQKRKCCITDGNIQHPTKNLGNFINLLEFQTIIKKNKKKTKK